MISLLISKMGFTHLIPFGDRATTFWVILDNNESHIHSLRFLGYFINCSSV